MALILNIDSSTTMCSVVLAENNVVLAIKELDQGYTHAENLAVFVADVLKMTGKNFKDLDAVAISKGPGSYTGLRIGVSFAKGLCYPLQIPLIGINTLQALAKGMLQKCADVNGDYLLCPMIDARRMEVYTQLFDNDLNAISETEAKIIDPDSFSEILAVKKILFAGNGAGKCIDTLNNPNVLFLESIPTSAVYMVELANRSFLNNKFEDVAYFEPYYLKEFVAGKKSTK